MIEVGQPILGRASMNFVLLAFILNGITFSYSTPTLTSSETSVLLGNSVTLTCTFPSQPQFLGMSFGSSIESGFCDIKLDCTTQVTGLCTGNTFNCSGDKLVYHFTLTSINDSFHDQTFSCKDAFSGPPSNEIRISVLVPVSSVTISPSMSQVDVVEGSNVNMTCSSDSSRPQSNITWYRNNAVIPGTTQTVTSVAGNKHTTTSVLTVNGNRNLMGAQISCSALNIQGQPPVTSSTKTINVQYAPSGTPVLTPSNPTVTKGNDVTLTCTLTQYGNPPATWSWTCVDRTVQQNEVTSITGQSVLRFTTTMEDNGRSCSCRAQSNIGNYDQTSRTSISVQYAPSGTPVLTPTNPTVIEGNDVTLTCTLTQYGNPPATWTWTCVDRTVQQSEVTSTTGQSMLRFTTTKADNGRGCSCRAQSNVGNYTQTSSTAVLNVQYPPNGPPTISGNPTGLKYNDSTSVSLNCTSGESNPAPTLTWNCNGLSKTEQTISTVLMFTVNKTFNGKTCECTATHPVENFRQQQRALLVVYYAGEILRVIQSHQQPHEGDNFTIEVQVDGNIPPNITWTNTDNNTVVKTDTTFGTSRYLNFPRINCLDTALYSATAFNGYGEAVNRSVDVSVFCLPRINERKTHEMKIPVGESKKIKISLFSVSNPQPSISWFFEKDNSSSELSNGSDIQVTMMRIQKVEYHIEMRKSGFDENTFGDYIAQLSNSVGKINITFTVFPQGPPNAPSGVNVECSASWTVVRWNSEFNGGSEQQFFIFSKLKDGGNFSKIGGPFTDLQKDSKGNIQLGEGIWILTVLSRNEFGEALSSSEAECTIKFPDDNTSALVAGVAGSLVAVICIAAAVIGFIYLKKMRNRSNAKGDEKRSDSTHVLNDPSDGVKDNILYQSADEAFRNPEQNNTYKSNTNNTTPSSDLYAVVDKSAKKTEKNKKAKVQKKSKGATNEGMVYENVSDIKETSFAKKKENDGTNKNSSQERGYRNEDGLLYVDVELKPKTDGKREVIIGDEERTDYASVDFVDPNH